MQSEDGLTYQVETRCFIWDNSI